MSQTLVRWWLVLWLSVAASGAIAEAKRWPVTLPVIYCVFVPMVIGGNNEVQ